MTSLDLSVKQKKIIGIALATVSIVLVASVEDYYDRASSMHVTSAIRTPTLLLASRDDPIIPIESLEQARYSSDVHLHVTDHGGHLGFLSRSATPDPDRRWMDWRIVEWFTANSL